MGFPRKDANCSCVGVATIKKALGIDIDDCVNERMRLGMSLLEADGKNEKATNRRAGVAFLFCGNVIVRTALTIRCTLRGYNSNPNHSPFFS